MSKLTKFHDRRPCSCILIAATWDQVSKVHKQGVLDLGEADMTSEKLHSSYRHFIDHIAKLKYIGTAIDQLPAFWSSLNYGLKNLSTIDVNLLFC